MNAAESNQQDQPNPEQASPATVEVDSLDHFVKLLSRWHGRKVAALEHFLKLPDGIEMQVGEDPSFKVEGDVRKGFLAGINMALMEFGTLPFAFEVEGASESPPSAQAQDPSGG